MTLPTSAAILCADVKSLYPSIPIDFGLAAVRQVLIDLNFDPAFLPLVIDLLQWVLHNNFLEFDGQQYLQLSGTAMGTPTAVCYANIVLFHLESPILNVLQPLYYRRYIDDIFAICSNPVQAAACVSRFNAVCPSIQLDAVTIGLQGVFLDMSIQLLPSPTPPQIQSFQKESNKYLFLPPTTSHATSVLINIIKQERRRFRLLNSREIDFSHIDTMYHQRLINRGYHTSFLAPLFSEHLDRTTLLATLRIGRARQGLKCKSKGPVFTATLPKLTYQPPLYRTLQLPLSITSHARYRQLYQQNLIIGKRYGKSIGRSLIYRKFSSRVYLQQSADGTAEDETRPVPNLQNPNDPHSLPLRTPVY
jgi:hypothetical protein